MTLAIIVVAVLAAWANHFDSSFHLDDIPAIVNNPEAHSPSNVPLFFSDPRTYEALPRFTSYRPLLFAQFAYDYSSGGADPRLFQFDTFFWFTLQLLLMYILFRLLSGGDHYFALFATTLYALHPALADTLDYTLQRGEVLEGVGITAALVLWIVWPRRLPPELTFYRSPGPPGRWQLTKRGIQPFISAAYRRIVKAPLPLYLLAVVFALLANPASVIFPVLLLVYIKLWEPETNLRRLIPAAAICGVYWVLQAAFTFRSGAISHLPLFAYWYTQPWIAMRFLWAFFVPLHLSADTDLQPLAHFWSPLALLGYAGVAALVRLAMIAGRREEWRRAAFGVWWFLIALLPNAIVPQQAVEADWRMYVPFMGLAFAVMSAAFVLFERWRQSPVIGPQVNIAGPILAALLIPFLVWGSWERNLVWQSDETLWEDVIATSPRNGHALLNYALMLISHYDTHIAADYIAQAAALLPHDAALEVQLALLANEDGRDTEAENHFRRAISFDPSYSPAFSYYGRWLMTHQRREEAFNYSEKAANLARNDLVARHSLLDLYAERGDWNSLRRVASETLRLDPNDVDGTRAFRVAQTGLDEIRRAETLAKSDPTADHYLNLSVVYFRNVRYQDSANAAREALKLHPDLLEAYFNLATVYHVMGKDDDAIAALREALRISPNFELAKKNLAFELAQKAAVANK
jgi:tetratricopeptide (TPR) repeat protein